MLSWCVCVRLVGGFGIGPKYLVDEYAVLDSRYWVLGDSMVAWVCYQEFFIMMPLELIWYIALQRKHWSRHYWAIVTGVCVCVCMCALTHSLSLHHRHLSAHGHHLLLRCGV